MWKFSLLLKCSLSLLLTFNCYSLKIPVTLDKLILKTQGKLTLDGANQQFESHDFVEFFFKDYVLEGVGLKGYYTEMLDQRVHKVLTVQLLKNVRLQGKNESLLSSHLLVKFLIHKKHMKQKYKIGSIRFKDNVHYHDADFQMRANQLELNKNGQEANLLGKVRFYKNDFFLKGDALTYDMNKKVLKTVNNQKQKPVQALLLF